MKKFFRGSKKSFSILVFALAIFVTGCIPAPATTTTEPVNVVSSGNVGSEYVVSQDEKNYLTSKFEELSGVNKDTIGYIYVPGGNMKEPVVQDKNDTTNSIYLDKTFEGNNVPFMGAVFMDYRNSGKFDDRLTWLFAHARGSGVTDYRMFKDVLSYTKQDFFDEHPYIVIETPERKYYYEALMIHEVHESTELYKTDSDFVENDKEAEFEEYFNKLSQSKTVFAKKDNLVFNPKDKHLVLSTCPDFIADPETRYNLYLRQIPDSELNEFLEKNKEKLAFKAN